MPSELALPSGRCKAGVRVDRVAKSGIDTLLIDGRDVGAVDIPAMATMVSSTSLDVGLSVAPVCHEDQPPCVFEGELHSVTFDIAASRPPQAKAEALATERPKAGRSRPPPVGIKQSGKATFA